MLTGSPLQYTVGKAPKGGVHKVAFGGSGAERGSFGVKSKWSPSNIYVIRANYALSTSLLDNIWCALRSRDSDIPK